MTTAIAIQGRMIAPAQAIRKGFVVAEYAPNSLSAYEFGEIGRYVEEFIWQQQRRDRLRCRGWAARRVS